METICSIEVIANLLIVALQLGGVERGDVSLAIVISDEAE